MSVKDHTLFDRKISVSAEDPEFQKLCEKTPLEPDKIFSWKDGVVDFDDHSLSSFIDADMLTRYCTNTKSVSMMVQCTKNFARMVEIRSGCPKAGKNKKQTWASIIKNKFQREIEEREQHLKRTYQRTIDGILLHVNTIQTTQALIDMMQATGMLCDDDQICSYCTKDPGPFKGCVIDSDPSGTFMPGCSNCRYQNHRRECT